VLVQRDLNFDKEMNLGARLQLDHGFDAVHFSTLKKKVYNNEMPTVKACLNVDL